MYGIWCVVIIFWFKMIYDSISMVPMIQPILYIYFMAIKHQTNKHQTNIGMEIPGF